jgi:release factor glutamine methyltransferase
MGRPTIHPASPEARFLQRDRVSSARGLVLLFSITLWSGCAETSEPPAPITAPAPPYSIVGSGAVEDFDRPLVLFESVFWEPDDTTSLRRLLRDTDLVRDKSVLEIGTGSGLVALCCLRAGAKRVVATDINPAAIQCAAYNALRLNLEPTLELRLVGQDAPQAFAVLEPDEKFDLIISNPPWEDHAPQSIAEFALYDRNFELLQSLLAGLKSRLNPGGKALLAYGCRTAITRLLESAAEQGYSTRILDDRDHSQLDEVFLPGMLIEVTPSEPMCCVPCR